jgi:hypothetical protein
MQMHLAAAAAALGLALFPALGAAKDGPGAPRPAKLTEAELDEVSGGHGHGPPDFVLARHHGQFQRAQQGSAVPQVIGTQVNFIIRDVTLTFNIGPNSPVNFAAVLQLSLLSQAAQTGSATAFQGH